MSTRNLTIKGKTDGFGCQLNAKLSGIAYCFNNSEYSYIHTPFSNVAHGWENKSEELNKFIGIKDNRADNVIHVVRKDCRQVFWSPNAYYTNEVLSHVRELYWSTQKPQPSTEDIVVHIRRGDLKTGMSDWHVKDRKRRYISNEWYNAAIPALIKRYPDHYNVAIHSEGQMEEFEDITEGWPKDFIDRTVFKLSEPMVYNQEYSLTTTFHEFVTAKVFLGSKSGLSYTASIYSEGDVFFLSSKALGQTKPLNHWKSAYRELK